MRRFAATAALLLLIVPASLPTGGQGATADVPLLRVYGCGDDLDATDLQAPSIGPDGALDCIGDRLRFPAAWLSGASDPSLRATLPTHDQRIDLTLAYHPTYWAPAPGTSGDPRNEIALPGNPGRGLFDVKDPGRFDASYLDDESFQPGLDDNDSPDLIDLAPHDGLVDRHERNDGRGLDADLYFPALEARYGLTWWRDAPDPVALPGGGGMLFPGVPPVSGIVHADAWRLGEAPPLVHWAGRPLGIGTQDDGIGALMTGPIKLGRGDTMRFLDHSVHLDRFVAQEGHPAVLVDVAFAGHAVPGNIGTGLLLDLDPTDQRVATGSVGGTDARNVLFADTRAVTREVPVPGSGDGTDDDAWFVLLERIHDDDGQGEPTAVTVRLGRLMGSAAPLNTMLVDGSLFHVRDLQERDGGLAAFAWSRIMPLGEAFRFRGVGVDVSGVAAGARIPLLPPFDRDHVHLVDIRPAVHRDPYGFLQEAPIGDGVIATGQLALQPGATTPQDRARRGDALDVHWAESGQEMRLGSTHVLEDGSLTRSLVVPFRYVTLGMPPVPALLHSALLDDSDLLQGATEASGTPRAARSFVFDPDDPLRLYLDRGLRIYGGTRADGNAADVLRLASGVIRPPEHLGQTRLPSALAGQRTDVEVRYQPYHIYQVTGRGLLPVSDESIDRDIDVDADPHIIDAQRGPRGDNLYDVAPRNDDPRLADVYGPVLEVRYTGRLIDPGTFRPIDAPFDAQTRIYVPAADRDPARVGLDSADMNGDGSPEGVVLGAFWDRDAGGEVADHWKTSGTFEAERDLVRLQSPLLEVPLGGNARFFDHGVVYAKYDGPGRGTGTFDVTDLQSGTGTDAARTLVTAPNVAPARGDCLTVRRDGSADESVVSCATRRAAATAGSLAVGPDADKWWVEIVEIGAASASVRMHRVFAPAADDEKIWIGGALYGWGAWMPGAVTGISSWSLEARVPLGSDVSLGADAPAPSLRAVPFGGRLPLLPPFDAPHLGLREAGVAAGRDTYGFDTGEPRDGPGARLVSRQPLFVQVETRDEERAHRFVHLDPTRWLDPSRSPGHAFVGATFDKPWAGIVATTPWLDPAPDHLRTAGRDGFGEALRGAGDRGWDHFVVLDLPADRGPYRLDSARLGAPSRAVAAEGAGDSWSAGRSSAYFLHDPVRPTDPYVPVVSNPVVPPVGVDPVPSVPAENRDEPDEGDGQTEDGPGPGLVWLVVLAATAAAVVRRWRP